MGDKSKRVGEELVKRLSDFVDSLPVDSSHSVDDDELKPFRMALEGIDEAGKFAWNEFYGEALDENHHAAVKWHKITTACIQSQSIMLEAMHDAKCTIAGRKPITPPANR